MAYSYLSACNDDLSGKACLDGHDRGECVDPAFSQQCRKTCSVCKAIYSLSKTNLKHISTDFIYLSFGYTNCVPVIIK